LNYELIYELIKFLLPVATHGHEPSDISKSEDGIFQKLRYGWLEGQPIHSSCQEIRIRREIILVIVGLLE